MTTPTLDVQPALATPIPPTSLPKQGFEVITPALAREWLKLNTNNRPLRRSHVEALKRMFERGEYRITHQGVGFAIGGALHDGQHRLTALSEMPEGFSVVMSVTHGLDPDSFDAYDLGAKRSNADSLRVATGLAEVGRFLAAMVHGGGNFSPQFVNRYVQFAKPYYEVLLEDLGSKRKAWSTATVRAAAIIVMARGVPASYVRDVYRQLLTANFAEMAPVVQAVFRAELNGRISASDKNDMFVRCLKIFNPKYADQSKVLVKEASHELADVRELLVSELAKAQPQTELPL